MTQRGEFEIIAELFAPLSRGYPRAFDLLDDAAAVAVPSGQELVVTKDVVVAGVHFLEADPPKAVAQKALRVNLSDLAAMGATPLGYLLGLSLPKGTDTRFIEQIAAGLQEDQAVFGIDLLGGDTVSTPGPLTLSITALGLAPSGRLLRRNGAHSGDLIFVTGTVGDAALGLAILQGRIDGAETAGAPFLKDRFWKPQPRVMIAPELIGIAHAAVDVSDGLVADLGHICTQSGLRADIVVERIPLSPAARALIDADESRWPLVLGGGDDYELLFTAPADKRPEIDERAARHKLPITEIGIMSSGEGVGVKGSDGAPFEYGRAGYTHF